VLRFFGRDARQVNAPPLHAVLAFHALLLCPATMSRRRTGMRSTTASNAVFRMAMERLPRQNRYNCTAAKYRIPDQKASTRQADKGRRVCLSLKEVPFFPPEIMEEEGNRRTICTVGRGLNRRFVYFV